MYLFTSKLIYYLGIQICVQIMYRTLMCKVCTVQCRCKVIIMYIKICSIKSVESKQGNRQGINNLSLSPKKVRNSLRFITMFTHCLYSNKNKQNPHSLVIQVAYYIEATGADNHAVREAACACIAELGSKVRRGGGKKGGVREWV